jgi:hypothetical protein
MELSPPEDSGIWRPEAPATSAAIASLRDGSPCELPESYFAQLLSSNGGEGELSVEPGWIAIWPAENVLKYNKVYSVAENVPGFFGFASDGGGELFAFDLRTGTPLPVARVSFVPMDARTSVKVAASFDDLREKLGRCRG